MKIEEPKNNLTQVQTRENQTLREENGSGQEPCSLAFLSIILPRYRGSHSYISLRNGMVKFRTARWPDIEEITERSGSSQTGLQSVNSFNAHIFLNWMCTREIRDVLKLWKLKH